MDEVNNYHKKINENLLKTLQPIDGVVKNGCVPIAVSICLSAAAKGNYVVSHNA